MLNMTVKVILTPECSVELRNHWLPMDMLDQEANYSLLTLPHEIQDKANPDFIISSFS